MTPSFWTRDRLAYALAGCAALRLPTGSEPLAGISTDTRALRPGDCFVALAGERFDAHEFLGEAVARGAAALVVSDPGRAGRAGVPVYAVTDTQVALGALGRHRRRTWGGAVVGVGGSNGKTTTKELLRAALDTRLEVHATAGNLNNLVGVPLTLLAIPDHADCAVVEMGINVPGEMERLRGIVEPDVALLTCVAEEHLEGLGSLEGVMREESFLFDGAAVAVVPAAQPEVARAAHGRARRVVTAGLDEGDVRAAHWGIDVDGVPWLEVGGATARLPVRGAHNLRNAVLAVAAAIECGVSAADAVRGLEAAVVPGMRVAFEPLGTATLVNDAYNASPASMRAALDLLDALPNGRQRVAVLGAMRELGAHAPRLHDEIARRALASSADVLAGVGEMGDALRAAAGGDPRVITAPDVDPLWPVLEPRLSRDAIVLLKASRGVRLERLVPLLTAWANR